MQKKNIKQTTLTKFVGQKRGSDSSSSPGDYDSDLDKKKGKAGMWSRVKTRDQFNAKRIVVFDLEQDLKKLRKDKLFSELVEENKDQILFDPDTHPYEEQLYDLEQNQLPAEELISYGELASELRRNFELKAKAIVDSLKQE